MGGLTHLLFAAAVLGGVIVGLVTGNWNAAIGLGIGWAFVSLIDAVAR